MLTLHKLTEEIRTILKWGAVAIGALILVVAITGIGKNIKEFFAPTPPPPPKVEFGKLPQIKFPQSVTSKKLTYSISTVTGELPNFEDRVNVHKLEKPQINLLALDAAKKKVSDLGFDFPETKLSQTSYQWSEPLPPYRKLSLNIFSNNFDLASSYLYSSTVSAAKNLPGEAESIEESEFFLSSILPSFPQDLDREKTKTTLFSLQNGKLFPSTSFSQAQVIRVDLFQKAIDKLPLVYPYPPFSTMSFFIASSESEPQVVEAHFYHKQKTNQSSTYPIKTAKEAQKELEEGKAYIAGYFGDKNEISIKNVYLAYYINEQEDQEFLLPVVVFEGDNGFYAYVSAIKSEWVF